MKISYEQKERLMTLINGINKKKYYIKIYKIIKDNNPTIEITENDNGILLFFDKLTDITYEQLNDYIKIINSKQKVDTSSDTLFTSDNDSFLDDSNVKYSNKEKSFIKKKMYNEAMNDQNKESLTYIKKPKQII